MPVEIPEVEVWRPARFERHARPQGRPIFRPGEGRQVDRADRRQAGPRRGVAAAAPGPAPGEGPAAGAEAQPRRDDRGPRRFGRDKERPRPNGAERGPPRPDRGPGEAARSAEDRKPGEGRRIFEGRTPGSGKPPPRPERGQRGDRNERDRDRDRGGARAWSSEPRQSGENRQPDPDSPFAKLLALKEQLQGQKPDKGQ